MDKQTLSVKIPHVWDVDGKPRGVAHELILEGETLTVKDFCLDEHGQEMDAGKARQISSMPFTQAVHILLNLTVQERETYGIDRTLPPLPGGEEDDGA